MIWIKKISVLFLLLICLMERSLSQAPQPIKWGKISEEQIDMTRYEYEPEAAVVILGDYGEWRPANSNVGAMILKRHIQYKILKEEGKEVAEQEIRFLTEGNTEQLRSLKAQTFNWIDDKRQVSKLSLKYLPEERINERWSRKTFVFKDVQIGSILELMYEIETTNSLSLRPWYFQSIYPTLYSEIRISNLQPDTYLGALRGATLPIARKNSRWIAKVLPSLKAEPHSASINDARTMIRFQLLAPKRNGGGRFIMPEKDTLIQQTWNFVQKQLDQDTDIQEALPEQEAFVGLVQSLIRDAITEEEKMAKIYRHVRDHFRWNGQNTTWVWRKPSEIYRQREANSAEINLTLHYLLQLADLTVRKCFASSRSHGKPFLEEPVAGQFDRMFCLVKAEETIFLLDATDPFRSYEQLDPELLNGYFYLLQGEKSGWVEVPNRYVSQRTSLSILEVEPTGILSGEMREIHRGYSATRLEKRLDSLTEDEFWELHHPELRDQLSDEVWKVAKSQAIPSHAQGQVELFYPIRCDSFVEVLGDRLFIDPMLSFGQGEHPFSVPKRIRAIDFGHQIQLEHNLTISIPDGYVVEKLPTSADVKMPSGEIIIQFSCEINDNKIFLSSLFAVRKPAIPAEEYPTVREMFSQIRDIHLDRIVLRKGE